MSQKDNSKYNISGIFGVGVNEGTISGIVIGQNNAAPNPELEKLGQEIGDRLTRLEKQYGNQTTQEQLKVTTEFVNELDAEPEFAQRVLSAIAVGGVEALKAFLIGPAASFLLGAVDNWQKTAKSSQQKLKE